MTRRELAAFFVIYVLVVVAIGAIIDIIQAVPVARMSYACAERGGIYVKTATPEGYLCVAYVPK